MNVLGSAPGLSYYPYFLLGFISLIYGKDIFKRLVGFILPDNFMTDVIIFGATLIALYFLVRSNNGLKLHHIL